MSRRNDGAVPIGDPVTPGYFDPDLTMPASIAAALLLSEQVPPKLSAASSLMGGRILRVDVA